MTISKEEMTEYLATDEGQKFELELKSGLLSKRDELLGQLTTTKEELNTLKSTENTRLAEVESTKRQSEEQRIKDTKDFDAYKLFHEQEVEKHNVELTSFKSKYANNEVERLITEVASANSKTPAPLRLLLKERVRSSINEDGKVEINVTDGKGETMYFDGQPATVSHLVESLKSDEQYSPFFAGTGVSGSGSQQGAKATAGSTSDMNSPQFNLTKTMGSNI